MLNRLIDRLLWMWKIVGNGGLKKIKCKKLKWNFIWSKDLKCDKLQLALINSKIS